MLARYLVAIALISMLLFSSTVPVYASHTKKTPPTEDEKRLFEKVSARLEKHEDLIETGVDDVKRSFSETVKIFFSCRNLIGSVVDSVTISVSTELVRFDEGLAAEHGEEVMLGAVYAWECRAVKDAYTLSIECTNVIMLNPDFVAREEAESGEKRIIAMAENEMTLYHELLHGQLMINVMKDPSDALGWRADACKFFARNYNELDYSASDPDHSVITAMELEFVSKLIKMNNGLVIVERVSSEAVSGTFTHVVANFDELGDLASSGMYLFARASNIEDSDILVSTEQETISISGILQDPEKDGIVRMFIMPRLDPSNASIELDVDDVVQSAGSEFVFRARVQNAQLFDFEGRLTLFIDGTSVASKQLLLSAGGTRTVSFIWRSDDAQTSAHSAVIDGFNSVSNEVTVMTFERLMSTSTNGHATFREQSVVDPQSGDELVLAGLERISAVAMVGDIETYDVRLFAPDGTLVVGEEGLVNVKAKRANLVKAGDQKLVVKFKDLNERFVFLAVKGAGAELLSSGDWMVKIVDSTGDDLDAKIKYHARYVEI